MCDGLPVLAGQFDRTGVETVSHGARVSDELAAARCEPHPGNAARGPSFRVDLLAGCRPYGGRDPCGLSLGAARLLPGRPGQGQQQVGDFTFRVEVRRVALRPHGDDHGRVPAVALLGQHERAAVPAHDAGEPLRQWHGARVQRLGQPCPARVARRVGRRADPGHQPVAAGLPPYPGRLPVHAGVGGLHLLRPGHTERHDAGGLLTPFRYARLLGHPCEVVTEHLRAAVLGPGAPAVALLRERAGPRRPRRQRRAAAQHRERQHQRQRQRHTVPRCPHALGHAAPLSRRSAPSPSSSVPAPCPLSLGAHAARSASEADEADEGVDGDVGVGEGDGPRRLPTVNACSGRWAGWHPLRPAQRQRLPPSWPPRGGPAA